MRLSSGVSGAGEMAIMTVRNPARAAFATGALIVCAAGAAEDSSAPLPVDVARGRYLVQVAGCNDCHTEGYALAGGQIDESKWLLGDALGWRGPWGTTYAPNLRLSAKDRTADEFLALARGPMRPPMPFFNLRAMTDADVKAIYAYLKHLGPAGTPAPAYVPPGQTPAGPYIQFPEPPPAEQRAAKP
jgi:mono/diheme cytochrome c family protein